MHGHDFTVLTPLLILSGSSVVIMLAIAFQLSHRLIQVLSSILFAGALVSLLITTRYLPYTIDPLLIIDGFASFIVALIIFSGLVVNILSFVYFDEKEESPKEYYVLLFLATLGACVLAISKHFISFFLGLELLSVGLYALIAYLRGRQHPVEASVKYLILAAFASAFLLFGMALFYLQTGSMEFTVIAGKSNSQGIFDPVLLTGLAMMLVGVGFKLAWVPFHMWAADVYEGAPAPITAFIATASKAGVFAVFYRFLIGIEGFRPGPVLVTLLAIAIASMLAGNILALLQRNVKRILAYSSIAHLGYLLVAAVGATVLSTQALSFYLVTYFLSSLAAFGVITVRSSKESDADQIESFRGMFWQQPVLAVVLTAALLSLAGIPLTAGFIGKFYVLASALRTGFWITAIILVLTSVIGLFYYLRIITAMFASPVLARPSSTRAHPYFYVFTGITLSVIGIFIVLLGVSPGSFLNLLAAMLGR